MKQLAMVLMCPDERWVRVKKDSGHLVYKGGELFLVVEEQYGGWLLCWRDGQPPPNRRILGSVINEKYIEEVQ